MNNILVLDVETSIYNKGNPFDPRNFLVSYAYVSNGEPVFKYYTDPDFISCIRNEIEKCSCIVGFNVKFDIHWLSNVGIKAPPNVKIWDCQIAEFIYGGQENPLPSLDDTCIKYGLTKKPDRIKEYWEAGISTENIPVFELEEYNIHDIEVTKEIYNLQQLLFPNKLKQLVLLEGEDLKTLQSAEYAGIKFNVDGAQELIKEQDEKLASINDFLSDYLPDGIPSGCFNWNSGDHLSALLYGGKIGFKYSTTEKAVYKTGTKKGQEYVRNRWTEVPVEFKPRFKPVEKTEVSKTAEQPNAETRFYQTNEPTLRQLKTKSRENKELLEAIKAVAAETKIKEMTESLLLKIKEKNWQDDTIHGEFNQVIARTGRLTSSSPNLQNQPEQIDKLLVSRYD